MHIKLIRATVVDGKAYEAGSVVETRKPVADHLIRIGKAEQAEQAEPKESKKSSSKKKKSEPKEGTE